MLGIDSYGCGLSVKCIFNELLDNVCWSLNHLASCNLMYFVWCEQLDFSIMVAKIMVEERYDSSMATANLKEPLFSSCFFISVMTCCLKHDSYLNLLKNNVKSSMLRAVPHRRRCFCASMSSLCKADVIRYNG